MSSSVEDSPDSGLLVVARAAWAAGDWSSLTQLPDPAGESAAAGVASALAFGGAVHAGQLVEARRHGVQALARSISPELIAMTCLASVEEDLAEAGASAPSERRDRARKWREVVLNRVAQMDVLAPATRLSRASEEATRFRAEVLRQRGIIEKLRADTKLSLRNDTVPVGVQALVGNLAAMRLTYLSPAKLFSLARTCRAIEEQHVPGRFVEAGCALGGSAILIASLKRPDRPLAIYDVFGMIPAPSEADTPDVHERYRTIVEGRSAGLGGDKYYGYETDLLNIVKRNFMRFDIDPTQQNVEFIQGLVQDTVRGDDPVALAHLDLDWYDPVTFCLEQLWARLSIGGSIIVDDYHDWGGCRRAVDRFLGLIRQGFVTDDSAGSLKITRVAA